MNPEEFLKAHQFTISALGVLGTFSAVVVALFNSMAAIRVSRTRVSARASINVIYHSTLIGQERPKYLVVSVRNLGIMPVHIPMGFFHWIPFRRGLFEVIPLDMSAQDQWAPQRSYPVEIKARGSDTFFLSDLHTFQEYALKDFIGTSTWSRFRSVFLRVIVFTDEGKTFNAKIDSSLRKELLRLRRRRPVLPP